MYARGNASGELGPIGRLGRAAARWPRRVFAVWALIAVGLGIVAPRVETALSGAGWQANGSESVAARERIDRAFGGSGAYALQVVVHSSRLSTSAPVFHDSLARVQAILAADHAVSSVIPPRPGLTISRDGHTAVVRATAAEEPNGMV